MIKISAADLPQAGDRGLGLFTIFSRICGVFRTAGIFTIIQSKISRLRFKQTTAQSTKIIRQLLFLQLLLSLLLSHLPSAFGSGGRCWSFSGDMTNMQPSNWLSPNNDIAFHLTFRRAQDKKVVMNSKPSGSSWHTAAVLSVPFNGPAKVDVSYDESTGFMVRLRDLTGNYGDVVYMFADRIPVPYVIASVNGEATGTEIACSSP